MQLAIDCASDEPAVALAVDGVAGLTLSWQTRRNHSVELLPNIERLLEEAGRTKADIDAVFVDTGPGGYAALRVGVSTAKALAHALGVPLVGVGRLELDAWAVSPESGGRRIIAVHTAGRGEVAWAAYRLADGAWREESPPALAKRAAFVELIISDDALTGDIDEQLDDAISRRFRQPVGFISGIPTDEQLEAFAAAIRAAAGAGKMSPARFLKPEHHRVVALARLGDQRLRESRSDDPAALVPLYLRAPAIGPQPA